jgi:hypothetical protein
MSRKNLLLVVILLVQAALVFYALKPEKQQTAKEKTFVTDIGKEAVTGLTIADDKQSLEIFKQDGKWLVDRKHKYPADAGKIEAFINKLLDLKSNRLVTTTTASHVRLKVADQLFNKKVTITAGDRHVILFFGTSPTNKTLHVRLDKENEVYLAGGLSGWEIQANSASWWLGKYIDLAADKITSLTVTNSQGSFTLQHKDDGTWGLAGSDAALASSAVNEFVGKAARLTLLKYLGQQDKKEYGLTKPAATLVYSDKDGSRITLAIGPKDADENNHVLKADDSPFYVSAASYVIEPLLQQKATSFDAPGPAAIPKAAPPAKAK